jgi:hypothetical protein
MESGKEFISDEMINSARKRTPTESKEDRQALLEFLTIPSHLRRLAYFYSELAEIPPRSFQRQEERNELNTWYNINEEIRLRVLQPFQEQLIGSVSFAQKQPPTEIIIPPAANIVLYPRDKTFTATRENLPVTARVHGEMAIPVMRYLVQHAGQTVERIELLELIDPNKENQRDPQTVVLDYLRHLQKNIKLKLGIVLYEVIEGDKDHIRIVDNKIQVQDPQVE